MESETEMLPAFPLLDERRALIMAMQALLDLNVLRVVAALAGGERSMSELAAELKVEPSLSRGPLGRLISLQIVALRRDGGRMICFLDTERLHALRGALQRLSREQLAREVSAIPGLAEMSEGDQGILRNYLRGEQITELPVGPKRMQALLRWLVEHFELGRRYPERELNEIIKRHHPDFATLRRELVDAGLMAREREVYWRLPVE
jgi:DNA-binding transcriptional ArsR family regulator